MSTIPKGFFPVQDTGVIQGVTQAAQSISFDQMATHQQELARRRSSKDPDVDSLSSFIGVDGSNVTLNSGRFLINLKPHDERKATRREIIRRLQRRGRERRRHLAVHAAGAGSVDRHRRSARRNISSRSRTRTWRLLQTWTPKVLAAARADRRDSSTSRATCSRTAARLIVDHRPRRRRRASASRRPSSTTRSTTPSASASSRPSSPRSNQYRVILDVDPTHDSARSNSLELALSARPRPRPPARCR